jgi:hypothetical protein
MKLEQARRVALSLPETTEEPHFELWSFRVKGKIFATVPADGNHLRIFVAEDEARSVAAANPSAFKVLWWGKRLSGIEADLRHAPADMIFALLKDAWLRKAPKTLLRSVDEKGAATDHGNVRDNPAKRANRRKPAT